MPITVPGSETNVLIGDLSPSDSYQVFVSAATSAGFGDYSSNLVIAQSKLSTVLSFSIIVHSEQFPALHVIYHLYKLPCGNVCLYHAKLYMLCLL